MDPLIRKVNNAESIEGLNMGNPTTIDKLCGYADDIVSIIKDSSIPLQNLNKTYHLTEDFGVRGYFLSGCLPASNGR